MKNFFDWEYNYDSFHLKDDKSFQNTDHTTGHAYEHIRVDPFHPDECRLVLNENEERMIYCDD